MKLESISDEDNQIEQKASEQVAQKPAESGITTKYYYSMYEIPKFDDQIQS